MENGPESTRGYSTWKEGVIKAMLEIESDNPPGTEGYFTGAFANAARTAMCTLEFEETVRAMFNRSRTVQGHHAVNLLLRAYQADQLEYNSEEYPYNFDDPERWLLAFEEVSNDADRWGAVYANLATRYVQSNIAERYKPIQMFAALMENQFDVPPSVLDVGCSALHGGIKLVYGNDPESDCPPFSSTEIVTTEKRGKPQVDAVLTFAGNLALSRFVEWGTVYGVDLFDINHLPTRKWAEMCTIKPHERLNPATLTEYRIIDLIDPCHERVQFRVTDFASAEEVRKFRDVSPVEKFNFVNFSTVLYQAESKEERINMIKHGKELLAPNGKMIVQDFPRGRASKNYTYTTELIDARWINDDPQTIMRWEDGRCTRAVIEDDNLKQALLRQVT
jgi:hypothetical protein